MVSRCSSPNLDTAVSFRTARRNQRLAQDSLCRSASARHFWLEAQWSKRLGRRRTVIVAWTQGVSANMFTRFTSAAAPVHAVHTYLASIGTLLRVWLLSTACHFNLPLLVPETRLPVNIEAEGSRLFVLRGSDVPQCIFSVVRLLGIPFGALLSSLT